MEFKEPCQKGFTIYSKSGCTNCTKIKTILKERNLIFNIIDCDDYIIEDKEQFFLFIKEKTRVDCRIFPIVFNDNQFIGGFTETKNYIDKNFLSFEDI
jgi:glutaredoxin